MRAVRRRPSTTEHGHAVSTRGYQSDPWSVERPPHSAPRSLAAQVYGRALTEVPPYQKSASVECDLEAHAGATNLRPDPRNRVAQAQSDVAAGLDIERVGEPRRAFVECAVGSADVAADDGNPVGHRVGDQFEQIRKVERDH